MSALSEELSPEAPQQPQQPPNDQQEVQWEPNTNTPLKIYINPLNHGFIVQVGCQKFAIEAREKLVKLLDEYLANPRKVQGQWFNGKFKI